MGHGNSLRDHEKGMIDAFEKDGYSQREIAKKINKSRCAVNDYIKDKNKTPKKMPGGPEKLSPRNKRAIIRDVRKSGKSVSQIQLPGDINSFTLKHIDSIKKIATMLNIQRDKKLLHGRNIT